MSSQYKQIFQVDGTFGFSLSGFIARMPNAMVFISLTLMLNSLGFSYSKASYVTATYITVSALLSSHTARLADRYGQNLIIAICTTISIIALLLLVICSYLKMSLVLLVILAFFAGFSPNFGALVRTRWSRLYSGTSYIRSAFAFESIVDEIVFMIGPVIAIAATTNIAPQAGILTALCFLIIGSISFITQKKTQPIPNKSNKTKSALRYRAILILAIILFVFGMIYGVTELSAIAFCKEIHKPAWAIFPLILYALASFITGYIYGAQKHIKYSLSIQLLISIACSAISTLLFLFVNNFTVLCFAAFCAGATCAPTLIIATALVENIIPEQKLTEGISWVTTGLNLGTSLGYAIVSPLLDKYGASKGFIIVIIAGFLSLFIASISFKKLK